MNFKTSIVFAFLLYWFVEICNWLVSVLGIDFGIYRYVSALRVCRLVWDIQTLGQEQGRLIG